MRVEIEIKQQLSGEVRVVWVIAPGMATSDEIKYAERLQETFAKTAARIISHYEYRRDIDMATAYPKSAT